MLHLNIAIFFLGNKMGVITGFSDILILWLHLGRGSPGFSFIHPASVGDIFHKLSSIGFL